MRDAFWFWIAKYLADIASFFVLFVILITTICIGVGVSTWRESRRRKRLTKIRQKHINDRRWTS